MSTTQDSAVSDSLPVIRAIFSLTGDALDFEELDRLLPVPPSQRGRKGDVQESGWPAVPETFWSYEHRAPADSIDDVLSSLLDRLEPCRDGISQLLRRTGIGAGFLINVTISEDRPLYCLSPLTLQRLAKYEVEVCLDIFDYSM